MTDLEKNPRGAAGIFFILRNVTSFARCAIYNDGDEDAPVIGDT